MIFCYLLLLLATAAVSQYTPDWPSIDSRPLPDWFDQSKIGIFIHWGPYAAPAWGSEWFGAEWFEWALVSGHNYPGDGGTPSDPPGPGSPRLIEFMNNNYPPGTTYQDLAKDLTASHWNPDEWVEMFQNAGAKYVVFTSKHHDGFTMWPSRFSSPPNWNSGSQGPERDIVGELAAAVKMSDLHFGLYYSLCEWLHPLWLQDKRRAGGRLPSGTALGRCPVKDTVVVNDRWAWDTVTNHGGYYTGPDKWNPGVLQDHKWENCFSLDKYSWGFRTDNTPADYMRPEEVIILIAETVSCWGNALINVSPTANGSIPLIEQQILRELGDWLGINGDAIYQSVPHTTQKDDSTEGIWYTSNPQKTVTYAMITRLPGVNRVQLGSIPYAAGLTVQLLGNQGNLDYACVIPCENNPGIVVTVPPPDQINSKYVWTLAISS